MWSLLSTALTRNDMKIDRMVVDRFIRHYAGAFDLPFELKLVPEDDSATPANQRIEAIYEVGRVAVHVEHTSFDMFHSGASPKRELDEGFKELESVLVQADFPCHPGLVVFVSMKAVANRKKLQGCFDDIIGGIHSFLRRVEDTTVNCEPYKATRLRCGSIELSVCLDPLLEGKTSLEYVASSENRYSSSELIKMYQKAFAKKVEKLGRSVSYHGGGGIGLLLIENHDVAVQSPFVFDRMFNETLRESNDGCHEVWLLRSGHRSLLWLREYDLMHCDGSRVDLSTAQYALSHREQRWRLWRESREKMFSCDVTNKIPQGTPNRLEVD